MKSRKKMLLIFLMLSLKKSSMGLIKHWLPNREWYNENNWVEGRVPDLDSRIIFPLEMRHVAGLPNEGNLRISEIELPADGALVLAKNGVLKISDKSKNEQNVGMWSRTGRLFWADPQNWNSTSEAVPHLERLPCQMDTVVLPGNDRVFDIIFPVKEIKVKSVSLDKKEISFSEWYQRSKGREFSDRKRTVSYSELLGCERCLCQEGEQKDYLQEICDIQKPRCGYRSCERPLKVEGHCCHYCGARLSLSKNVYTRLVNRLTNEALNRYDSTISWHVRTTWGGSVEILIVEKGQYSGIISEEALKALESYLKEQVKTISTSGHTIYFGSVVHEISPLELQVEGIQVLFSEISGESIEPHQLSGVFGPILGGLMFALVSYLIIFSYYGYSYSQILDGTREIWFSIRDGVQSENSKDNSYGFARFENLPEGEVQLTGSGRSEEDEDNEEPCSSGGRFENPLYRSKRESKKETQVEEAKIIDFDSPVSLMALKNGLEDDDDLEDIAIEDISETEQ